MGKRKATKKQYIAVYQTRWMQKQNIWWNARKVQDGNTYYWTEEEARAQIAKLIAKHNGKHQYNADGKRYETSAAGSLGVSLEITKEVDDDNVIVAWRIKVREVTEWEIVDEM